MRISETQGLVLDHLMNTWAFCLKGFVFLRWVYVIALLKGRNQAPKTCKLHGIPEQRKKSMHLRKQNSNQVPLGMFALCDLS